MAMTVVGVEHDAPADRSTDFERDRIPPLEFPIAIDGHLYRDGQPVRRAPSTSSALSQTTGSDRRCPTATFFLGFAGNSSLARAPHVPPDGDYEYRVTMTGAIRRLDRARSVQGREGRQR